MADQEVDTRGKRNVAGRIVARPLGWLAQQAVTAAIAALVGGLVVASLLTPDDPSIAQQLDRELSEAAKSGYSIVINRAVDLHGTGVRSRLVVLAPTKGLWPSDEIRIYDEIDGELILQYAARPAATSKAPGYGFRLLGIGKYDSTDQEQIIASLDQRFANGAPPHPIVVVWNVRDQIYEMRGLLDEPPSLPKMRRGVWGEGMQRFYRIATDVRLRPGLTLRGLRGAGFVEAKRGVLIAGYVTSAECHACPAVWSFQGRALDFQAPVYKGACAIGGRRSLTARIARPQDFQRALASVRRRLSCV